MEKRRVDVSVVIPCFNAAPYLAETLQSVLDQTVLPQQILVVDDGSTDDSAKIAKSFGDPVRVLQQRNQGESVARNVGIDAAVGRWVAFLDADDIWESTKLEEFERVLRTSAEDLVCVHSDFYYFNERREKTFSSRPAVDPSDDLFLAYLEDWRLLPSATIVPTDLARAIRFPESVQHSEDMIFFAQVVLHGKTTHISKPLTGYRLHAMQQTKSPHHHLQSILSRIDWLCKHPQYGSTEVCKALRHRLGPLVVGLHDRHYWCRDWDNVKVLRQAYAEILPEAEMPFLMKRWLPPALLLKWKDRLDSLFEVFARHRHS